jgi:hypothetical protein
MTKGLPTSTFESFRSSLCVAAPTHQTGGGELALALTVRWPRRRPRSSRARPAPVAVTCICILQRATR